MLGRPVSEAFSDFSGMSVPYSSLQSLLRPETSLGLSQNLSLLILMNAASLFSCYVVWLLVLYTCIGRLLRLGDLFTA